MLLHPVNPPPSEGVDPALQASTYQNAAASPGSAARIPLTRGKYALVDAEDYERVAAFRWHLAAGGYAGRDVRVDGQKVKVYLHRYVLGDRYAPQVDHRNGDKLDCRRHNLRAVTPSQNGQNRQGPNRRNTTGVRGVTWLPRWGRYWAYLRVGNKQVSLKTYATLEEAAAAVEAGRARYMTHAPECEGVAR